MQAEKYARKSGPIECGDFCPCATVLQSASGMGAARQRNLPGNGICTRHPARYNILDAIFRLQTEKIAKTMHHRLVLIFVYLFYIFPVVLSGHHIRVHNDF